MPDYLRRLRRAAIATAHRHTGALVGAVVTLAVLLALWLVWRGGQAAALRERNALAALRTLAAATDSARATVARLRADSARTARTIDSLWQVAADLRRAKRRTVTRWRDAVAVSVVDSVPCEVRIGLLVAAGDSVAAVADAAVEAQAATVAAWRASEDSTRAHLATLAAQLDTARAAQRVAAKTVRRGLVRRTAGAVGRVLQVVGGAEVIRQVVRALR